MVFFKNDSEATKCLEEWRAQCIKWCYLRYENGQIGDQGYLNDWTKKYKGVNELIDKGVNLGSWNIDNYKITTRNSTFFVDEEQLVCYHFHGLKLYFNNNKTLKAYPITVLHEQIYKICLDALQKSYDQLQKLDSAWTFGTLPDPGFLRILKQKIIKVFKN